MPDVEPKVGMGVTYAIGADYYPYTIVRVVSPKKLEIVRDEICGEHTMCSLHMFQKVEPDTTITLRKNGKWIEEGSKMRNWGTYHIGYRADKRDPHF